MENHELEHLAVLAALTFGREHSYVNPGFTPHPWVIEAMKTAYKFGYDQAVEDSI